MIMFMKMIIIWWWAWYS